MSRLRTRLAPLWPQLTLLGYALFSFWPLLRPQLTCTDDAVFHMSRAVSLEAAIRNGHWLARWLPDMAQGYGYPNLNFYGPLPSYLMVALHSLGLSYPTALHLLFMLALLIGGLATLSLVQRWWGPWAGLVAGVAYLSAPYFAFNVLFRGALAESIGLMWPPVVLLALDIGLRDRQPGWQWLGALAFAALLFSHNSTALLAAPLIAGYGLLLVLEQPTWANRQTTLFTGLWVGLSGAGLSARFFIPALLETGLVQSDRLYVPPIFTYDTNFITLRELLALPSALQPLLLNPSPAKGLGLVAILLALLGLLTVLRPATPHRVRLLFFGGFLAVYSLLTLQISQPIWDVLPPLQAVQFPWRLLGTAMLAAAILTGAAVNWLTTRPALAASLLGPALILAHLFWWSPTYCAPFFPFDQAAALRAERDTNTIGATAKGEFLPVTVRLLPPDTTLADDLIAGRDPNWLLGLPATALTVLRNDPLDYRAQVVLTAATPVTFHQFYYPGWQVRLNGQPLPITVTRDYGLISFTLPPGEHTLNVFFGPTPLRAIAEAISLVTFLLGLMVGLRRPPARPTAPADTPPLVGWANLLILLPIVLLIVKLAIIDTTANPFRQATRPPATPLTADLALTRVDVPAQVASGAPFDAIVELTATQPITAELRPRFNLTSANGLLWNMPNDALPPRWHREPPATYAWPHGHYAQWARTERIRPGTPPGDYSLSLTVFDLNTLQPLTEVPLGTVTVTRPAQPADPADLHIQYRLDPHVPLTADLTLLGHNLDREQARPGDPMLLTFFWQATATPTTDQTVTLTLGKHTWTLEPTPGFATSHWQSGDVWYGQHAFYLPADLATGDYTWQLNGQPLRGLQIIAPTRQFTAPADALPVNAAFTPTLTLAAADLPSDPQPGQPITLTLWWTATATPTAPLTTFVHVVNASGQIVAQADSPPANGDRPATGWLPNEAVPDAKTLTLPADLPPGDYTLLVGLVDATTGALLPAPAPATPDGRLPLTTLTLP